MAVRGRLLFMPYIYRTPITAAPRALEASSSPCVQGNNWTSQSGASLALETFPDETCRCLQQANFPPTFRTIVLCCETSWKRVHCIECWPRTKFAADLFQTLEGWRIIIFKSKVARNSFQDGRMNCTAELCGSRFLFYFFRRKGAFQRQLFSVTGVSRQADANSLTV